MKKLLLFFIILPILIFTVIVISGCSNSEEKVLKPNILFICTDDQAAFNTGISGNMQIHTPNIDMLAHQGAYFPNSFVSTPVCSPSRASSMTGQYASELGIYDFIPSPGHKLYNQKENPGLDPNSLTFPELLHQNGYKTGLIGKWHLGDWLNDSTKKFHPTNHGFDYFMGLVKGGTTPVNPQLEKDGVVLQFEGLTTDILTEHALSFIKENAQKTFLLCLHYRAPHKEWLPVAEDDWKPYENLNPAIPNPEYPDLNIERVKKDLKEYMASTSGVDRNLAKILKLLEELNLDQKTIVIFTSDNGYNMGHNGITHKGNGQWVTLSDHPAQGNIEKNQRPNLFDNSLKVPAIIRWPGVIKPGKVIPQYMTNLDWYPTLAEIAGAKVPENKIIRGRSLVPLLKGETSVKWENDIYAEYSQIHYSKAFMRTYRTPEWKLVRDFLNPGRDELYNLSTDPEESKNLINSTDSEIKLIMEELNQKILIKMKEVQDPLLKQVNALNKPKN